MPPTHRPGFHRWGARALLDLKNNPPPAGPLLIPEIASAYVVRSLHRVAARWCLGTPVVDVEVGVGAGGPEVRGLVRRRLPRPGPRQHRPGPPHLRGVRGHTHRHAQPRAPPALTPIAPRAPVASLHQAGA